MMLVTAQTGALEGDAVSKLRSYVGNNPGPSQANWDVRLQAGLGLRTQWLEKTQNVRQGSSRIRAVLSTLLLRQGNCVLLLST